MIEAVSPALPLLLGAALAVLLRGRARDAVSVAAAVAALGLVLLLPDREGGRIGWLGFRLVTVAVDPAARLFGAAFAIAALAGIVHALAQRNPLERAAALLYAGAALGIVFAGDLVTFTIFFELLAVGSTLVVWSGGRRAAALRYAAVHAFAGALLIAGAAAASAGGVTTFAAVAEAGPLARGLLLAGLLVNAGAFPFSFWVADAYPKASWSGAVFLSAFTTKAAVYGLIRLFPGESALVVFGAATVVYGAIYALNTRDLRALLSYSIVGQVGIMLMAVGTGSALALAAAALHAFAHVVYKAMMMMAAGGLVDAQGRTPLGAIGPFRRSMPVTALVLAIGALALSGLPLTAGFVSKSALSAALGKEGAAFAWFLLTASSAATFLYAVCRPLLLIETGAAARPLADPSPSRLAPMVLLAALTLAIGFVPAALLGRIPGTGAIAVLTPDHIVFQLAVLAAAALVLLLARAVILPGAATLHDIDSLWRTPLWRVVARWLGRPVATYGRARAGVVAVLRNALAGLERQHGPQGALGRNWPTGSMALSAAILLGATLLLAYI
ncbi:proton-conducting transporter membrane subunit [Prosthecomicrobium pneumaticum]|uniref:Multicomponent Na+:H+ antiporter subunit D n=1 Tax=Prosthecomicrobium pneumaticum TaxID=81895 RepID=A0A7W9CTQ5_9HYPH|nr:proton-conducting transporter membrane subunit [Prosthecomicrobium pneumaticum]MBB5751715.1 multicomponent Na+:H+ antiporter subunit D [Prosthecomicrobium pneumaticum]